MIDILGPGDPLSQGDIAAALNAAVSVHAPCLDGLPPDHPLIVQATVILKRALARQSAAGFGAVESQTAGPYSQRLRADGSATLTGAEMGELAGLCGQMSSGAKPRGTFPRGGIDRIFDAS